MSERSRWLAALLFGLALAWLARSLSAAATPPLEYTPEWRRLVALWHVLLDHSSNAIYSPARLQSLAPEMERMEADLGKLAAEKRLAPAIADGLRGIFRDRHQYLEQRHYSTEPQVSLSATEAAAATAQWVIELELEMVRRSSPPPESARRELAASSRVIEYELAFLRALREFEAETERRRQALADREATGEEVDWKTFENECQRRRNLLLDAYHKRRLRPGRAVRELVPYMLMLTTARPPAPAEGEAGGMTEP